MIPAAWTNKNKPTLELLVSATTAMRGHRWEIKIPFNTLQYDGRTNEFVRPFNVSIPSVDFPAGTRLLSISSYRNEHSSQIRRTVLAGVKILLECDTDAAAFDDLPLQLVFDGAANETDPQTVLMPAITPTTGTPWTVRTLAAAAVGCAIAQLPAATGARNYKGTWDADANSPELTSGEGTTGDTYIVAVAGDTELDGTADWEVGDELSFNGDIWQRIPVNTGVFRISNNLAEGNAVIMRGNLGLRSYALKADDFITIDAEGLSGIRNLLTTDVAHQSLHIIGKTAGALSLKIPADTAGNWAFVDETTGGYDVSVINAGGQLKPIIARKRPAAAEIFVVNQDSASISVIDADSGAVLNTWTPAGLGMVWDLQFSADGNTAYLSVPVDALGGKVKLLDAETGVLSGTTWDTPPSPRGLCVDATNGALWVSCSATPVKVRRLDLADGSEVATITIADGSDEVAAGYGADQMVLNADASLLFLMGRVGSGFTDPDKIKRAFVIDTDDNSLVSLAVGHNGFEVGGNGSGGLAIDGDHLYISRGSRSLRYFDVESPFDLQGGVAVGTNADYLLLQGGFIFASNTDDKTISVYSTSDFSESPRIALDYAPGMLAANGSGKFWVCFPDNNALGLIDPATGIVERLVALGPLEPLVLKSPVTEVKSDGTRLWKISSELESPFVADGRLPWDPQPWFEQAITDPDETPFRTWLIRTYAASASTDVPYARVVKTVGTQWDQIVSDYIPVKRGAVVHFSAWVMRPSTATGTAGLFQLQINLFDKNKYPASSSPISILSNNPAANDTWAELQADYTLPLEHDPIDNSDGGAIAYITVVITVNKAGAGSPEMKELQWGAVRISYPVEDAGFILGPSVSTDKALLRWNGSTGDVAQNSDILVSDPGGIGLPDQAEPGAPAGWLYAVAGALKWAGKFVTFWEGAIPSAAAFVKVNSSGRLESATMATGRLLGRFSPDAGPVEDVEIGDNLEVVDGRLNATGGGSAPAIASQAEAEGGTENTKMMTALRVWQAITAFLNLGSLAGQAGKALVVNGTEDGIALATVGGGGGGVTVVDSLPTSDSSTVGNLYLLNKAGASPDRLFVGIQSTGATYRFARVAYDFFTASGIYDANDIADLRLWLKADSLTLSNGDLVATWEDQSANVNNATQITSGNRPTFVTNVINSLPVVRFDGANDWVQCGTNIDTTTGTLFFVAKYTGSPGDDAAAISFNGLNVYAESSSYPGTWALYLNGMVDTGASNADFSILGLKINSYDDVEVRVNDGSTNNVGGSGFWFRSYSRIGVEDSGGQLAQMDVAEIIVWDRVLTSDEYLETLAYLMDKYGF